MKSSSLLEMPVREEPPQNIVPRADIMPADGFVIEVDGRMKAKYHSKDAVEAAALELKARFPNLQIKVYDAAEKTRTLIDAPQPNVG